jgi:dolichol-phosphate mannosyltransferase
VKNVNDNSKTKLAIVIPTYNEADNICEAVSSVEECFLDHNVDVQIVVVDDNSNDGTADKVRDMVERHHNIYLLSRPAKLGLGSAYVDGFKWILQNDMPDIVLQMDADLSHPPQLAPKMVEALNALNSTDILVASRYHQRGSTTDWPLYRKIISRGANSYARFVLGMNLKDMTSGYKALRIEAVKKLISSKLSGKGYVYQIESMYIASKLGMQIREIPYKFQDRVHGKSKLGLKDIVDFLLMVLKLKLANSLVEQTNVIQHEPSIIKQHEPSIIKQHEPNIIKQHEPSKRCT